LSNSGLHRGSRRNLCLDFVERCSKAPASGGGLKKITAADLLQLGVVDLVLPNPPEQPLVTVQAPTPA